jgi:hypothetical protein
MATHASMPTRGRNRARTTARRHGALGWALPLALGVIFGFYAAFILRVQEGGRSTGGQVVLGVVAGVALAALCFALGRIQHALPRELRALAYGALTALAIGFLVSLDDSSSVLRSSAIGLAVGAGVLCAAFYLFYTREE